VGLQCLQRAPLVDAHQPRIAGDISRQYRRQSRFQTFAAHETLTRLSDAI
jgi:hypothetical protein